MTDSKRPLDGLRVIELGQLIAGPFCGQLLGDFGAEVIKVEAPGLPDPARGWGAVKKDDIGLFWPIIGRNKKSLTLNLRVEAGQAILRELVKTADILVENFRPGTLERWGLGPDVLHELNPRLVITRVSGYGQTGPESHKAGYASVGEAKGGLRYLIGDLIGLAASQPPYLREIGLLAEGEEINEIDWLLDSALTGPIVFLPWSAGVMSHFERDLYANELPADQLNTRWWEHVRRFQGIAPPSDRPAAGCDACTKTHINDDPAQYYDYALANVLVYQLHDHICRNILEQDPHACNYYESEEVGAFLRAIMSPGATRDWREVLREHTGQELTAEPMLEYYRPLMAFLEGENEGRDCSWPAGE